MRKVYGTIAALAMALSLVGMAWASQSVETDAAVSVDAATAADVGATQDDASANAGAAAGGELGLSTSSEIEADGKTAAQLNGEAKASTSATVEAEEATPSTTVDTTTTTTEDDDTTSTTVDDNEIDNEETVSAVVGLETYEVANVGEVTINVLAKSLTLVSVDAPGWEVEIENVTSDRIEIEFHKGDAKAEFEAELQSNGLISIETRSR